MLEPGRDAAADSGVRGAAGHCPSVRPASGNPVRRTEAAAIAAVLAMEPSIIVLDEAASMLDEKAKHESLDFMRTMHAEGRYTIISITHDVEEMAEATE